MTKKERKEILKAIGYFLDSDPNKWIDGIDTLFLLAHNIRWSEHLRVTGKVEALKALARSKQQGE